MPAANADWFLLAKTMGKHARAVFVCCGLGGHGRVGVSFIEAWGRQRRINFSCKSGATLNAHWRFCLWCGCGMGRLIFLAKNHPAASACQARLAKIMTHQARFNHASATQKEKVQRAATPCTSQRNTHRLLWHIASPCPLQLFGARRSAKANAEAIAANRGNPCCTIATPHQYRLCDATKSLGQQNAAHKMQPACNAALAWEQFACKPQREHQFFKATHNATTPRNTPPSPPMHHHHATTPLQCRTNLANALQQNRLASKTPHTKCNPLAMPHWRKHILHANRSAAQVLQMIGC